MMMTEFRAPDPFRPHPAAAGLAVALLLGGSVPAGEPLPSTNPRVERLVASVSEERLLATVERLASFGTRHLYSDPRGEERGTGAARRYLAEELKAASPRMQVSLDLHRLAAQGGRLVADVDLVNVVGVLPGRTPRRILVSGHYDSLARGPDGEFHWDRGDLPAPGANDDGSGTAAVLELARVLGGTELDATLVFVAFDGEEEGLVGATLYASRAARQGEPIEAVLNNDIIGNEIGGSGRIRNHTVHLYSNDPADSPSRELARHIEWVGEAYLPGFDVRPVFRYDRFGRGGDHTPFEQQGFAAVRFTVSEENYARQHTVQDTPDAISSAYLGRVVRVNAAVLASLALAPPPPRSAGDDGRPLIDRGESGYDARVRWEMPDPPPDLAGFEVLLRDTTAPRWERSWFAPPEAREMVLPGVLIDTVTLGVRAVDREGNRSMPSVYRYPQRRIPEYRLRP